MSIAFTALPTQAQTSQPLAEPQRLIRQGQPAQALERIDAFLASSPKDPQGRFLRGVALTELNRTAEAIEVFQRLSEDYPELPEPYNNLAVLYALQKQYDKARGALEMAIRTHPAYATAHENLGDIYAKLASQAYDKALQLDSANATTQTKLSMIRELISLSIRQSKPAQPAQPQPPVRPLLGNLNQLKGTQLAMGGRQPVLPLPETAGPATRQPTPRPPAATTAAIRTPSAAAPPQVIAAVTAPPTATTAAPIPVTPAAAPKASVPAAPAATPAPSGAPAPSTASATLAQPATKPATVAATAAPAGPTPTAPATPAKEQDATRQVTQALESWARAWSSKDFRSYLAAYAPKFSPQGGQSRQAWAAEREARVTKPGRIAVTVQSVKVSFESGGRAVASFRQQYRSSNLNSTASKTLVFVQQNGRWLIAEERVR